MKRVSKVEAARRLGVSLSTVDRMIARGDLDTEVEPRGRRHRKWILLDADDTKGALAGDSAEVQLAAALERVRSLEELVGFHREQLAQAEARQQELIGLLQGRMLPEPERATHRRTWWPW